MLYSGIIATNWTTMKRLLTPYFNLPYWSGSMESAARKVHQRGASHGKPFQIVTVNAEMVIHGLKNNPAAAALLSGDFFIADTMSIAWWLRLHGKKASRIAGIDFAHELLITSPKQQRVAIIGGYLDHVRECAAQFITNAGGEVVYSTQGPTILNFSEPQLEPWLSGLRETRPDIIFIAFNHGKQEWWGQALKNNLDFPVIIMGVGGTLDVWGGKIRRAPSLMRKMGFEWLWRLMLEPKRFKRIVTATIIFPYRAIRDNLV